MTEPTRQGTKQNNRINYWKWAFISLVILFAVGMVWFVRALQPVKPIEDEMNSATIEQTEDMEITSELSKEDVEFVLNSFLESETENTNISYQIQLGEELNLSSNVEWMGLTIPFLLTFEPYATEEGNLQLRAQSVEVASFSLPVQVIMAALGKQMDLPSFIQMDSEAQMILVNFKELRDYYPYGIELEKVDLENDEIQLKLFVNKDTLKRALDSEKVESSSIE